MRRVAVVADTTGYLPRDVVQANDIRLVSLYVNFGGDRTEREADLVDLDAFYDELRAAEQLPTTSQPAVGDFIEMYEPLLADGTDIISVHISAGLSGTCESARQAAEQLQRDGKNGERVHVFDSATGAGGLGLVMLAAARAANQGADLEAVVARTRQARENLKLWFAVDTLEFLKRGGRIGAASAWIGSTLKIKPILSCESELVPVERVRTSSRAFERLVDYGRQRHESGADGWVVQHVQAHEEAERLVHRCRDIFGSEPVFTSEVGPVIGAHVGPGLLGIGSVPRDYVVD